jgi:AcrR family transcriptional regulator
MPPDGGPQSLRDLRRQQILKAARGLVAERGLDALTIGALEGELAFSRGVITYHFKNKDEIVYAVLEGAVDEIDAAVDTAARAAPDVSGSVEAVIRGMAHGFLEREEAGQILLAFWSRVRVDERAAAINADLYDRYRKQTARLIRKGQRDGAFTDAVDARALAAHIVGTVIGVVTQALFASGAVDADAVLDEAVASVMARLRA